MNAFVKFPYLWGIILLLQAHDVHSGTSNKKTLPMKFLRKHALDFLAIKTMVSNLNPQSSGFSVQICRSCRLVVELLQKYLAAGASAEDTAVVAYKICTTFKIETPRVCSGITKNFQNMWMPVGQVDLSPDEICRFLYQTGCGNTTSPVFSWNISPTSRPKPSVVTPMTPKPSDPILRVLHITDLHLDPYYAEGTNANCTEPLCCREVYGKPLTSEDAAGPWGHVRNCDTPLRTFENMLQHINDTQKVDYVIYTGDTPPHDIWNNSRTDALHSLHSSTNLMQKYFTRVPVFPAIGNHESAPINSFPVPQIKGNESISWLYEEIAKTWGHWIPGNKDTLLSGAYYSAEIFPGFRIISLNMNYCYNMNWYLLLNSTDPTGQLAWLVQQLQMAEDEGEKVHIIGHIPPGDSSCVGVWSVNYNRIIERYENTVMAQFFGHTHNDGFAIFYDKSGSVPRPTNIAYVSPSVSTFEGYYPAFRIYTVDGNYPGSSRIVLDHETYYLNLTEANAPGHKPEWKLRYSAKKDFGLPSLLPTDWDHFTKRLEDDDDLFRKFLECMSTGDPEKMKCDKRCKKMTICRLRRGQSNDPVFC